MSSNVLTSTGDRSRPSVNLTPAREPRCRYHNRLGDPCPNPSVDPDQAVIQICVRHLGEALALFREHHARTTNQETN